MKRQENSPRRLAFLIALAGLALFLFLLVIFRQNFLSKEPEPTQPTEVELIVETEGEEEDFSITHYFEKAPSGESEDEDAFLQNDPFREDCAASGAEEGSPVIYSNTVCLR